MICDSSDSPGGPLGAFLGRLGCLLGRLGALLDRLGAVLGASWAVLGASWGVLGRRRAEKARKQKHRKHNGKSTSLASRGPLGRLLRGLLGHPAGLLGCLESRGPSWASWSGLWASRVPLGASSGSLGAFWWRFVGLWGPPRACAPPFVVVVVAPGPRAPVRRYMYIFSCRIWGDLIGHLGGVFWASGGLFGT